MRWNSHETFGTISKTLHWFGAALILAMFALGAVAVKYPLETPEQMAAKWELFALHKTVGVCAFFFGVVRVFSMWFQPKPAPLAHHGMVEIFAARTVHSLLTVLMIAVPLAGWVRHASLPGFAPIYLPFGDSLPFVPPDPHLSEMASMVHFGFVVLLGATILLHVSGALKHHLWDRDATLKRMLPGKPVSDEVQAAPSKFGPALLAIGLITCVALIAIANTPEV